MEEFTTNLTNYFRQLRQRDLVAEKLNLELTTKGLYQILSCAYQARVEQRHKEYQHNEEIDINLWQIAAKLKEENLKGVLLEGNFGNGKTTAAYAIIDTLEYARAAKKATITSVRLVDAIRVNSLSDEDLKLYKECQVLVIEDLGREETEVKSYGNKFSLINELLEDRYNKQRITIITTNLNEEEIEKKYGGRIADRFKEMFTPKVKFENNTYR